MELTELLALLSELRPRPWRWQQITPRPSRLDPEPKPTGTALVAADGTWLLWSEEGYGNPEVASAAVSQMLAAADELLDHLDAQATGRSARCSSRSTARCTTTSTRRLAPNRVTTSRTHEKALRGDRGPRTKGQETSEHSHSHSRSVR